MIRKILLASAALAFTQPAMAATWTFTLGTADSSAGLGTGPFGTVTVTESAGSLIFTETLNAGYKIHGGNTNHSAFAFSLTGDPAVTITGLTTGFTATNLSAGSNQSEPPFGSFATTIVCSGCGAGYAGGNAGPLTFTVSASSALSLSSLAFNVVSGQNIYFTSDLVNAQGSTGNVGATLNPSAVPEPASWAMMLIGFGGLGYAMRRRPKVATRILFA